MSAPNDTILLLLSTFSGRNDDAQVEASMPRESWSPDVRVRRPLYGKPAALRVGQAERVCH